MTDFETKQANTDISTDNIDTQKELLYEDAKNIFYHSSDSNKLKEASAILHNLGDYKEASMYAAKCDTMLEYSVGNIVSFGTFEGQPIRWKVLEANGKIRLLITENILTYREFNKERDNTNWSTCTLRKWLNGEFLNKSFTLSERMSIFATRRDNNPNQIWSTPCGPRTMDKAFVFSHEEAEQYLPNPEDRIQSEWWWTRTLGHTLLSAECVYTDGSLYDMGLNIADPRIGVRPCIWVMLR